VRVTRPAPGAYPVKRKRRAWARSLIPLGTTLALLAVWEVLTRAGVLPPEAPPFTDVVDFFVSGLSGPAFWTALGQTLWHWFAGLLIGGVAGVVLGVAIGAVPLVHRLLNVPLEFLRPIPPIVYLPLLILVMGAKSQTAILLVSVGALWPLLYQSIYGVQAIDPQAVETGKVFGLTRWQRLWSIMLPSVLPYLATGARIASSIALIVAVSVELVAGIPGLGAQLSEYAHYGVYPGVYSVLLTSGLLGLLLNAVIERTEKRLLHWHVAHRVVNP
jgi:ABC-type nitrate/sulfonate/bicarbonate transport system permease component